MRGRDREAQWKKEFEELTYPHLGALYRFAVQKVRDAHQAEDLVQEACLKAYRAFDHFERGTNYRAWLFRILSNALLDLQRKASKKPLEVDFDAGRSVFHLNIEAGHNRLLNPEQQLMAASVAHEVRTAIADLPPEWQAVVLLSFVEGFSYKEIADILGCPIGTVMSRLYRARQVLRQRLERHLYGEDDAGTQPSRGESAPVTPIDRLACGARNRSRVRKGNAMECEEARFGLYALLDNELDIPTNLEVLSHLEGCPFCQRELELDARLKALVREQLSTEVPPPELWGRVMQRIERETEGARPSRPVFGRRWPRARLSQAAAAAVVVLFALSFFLIAQRDGPVVLLDELVKDHLRSVKKESGPADVPFSDPHEILAHFRTQVPPSLPVPLIIYEGARLLGGSFCRLGHTKGIRFTYQVEQGETVSLYQLDRADQVPFSQSASGRLYISRPQGPSIVLWGDGGLLYALVGELGQQDLQRLAAHMGSL